MPIAESVTLDRAVELLNEALKLDHDTIEALVEYRVGCNKDLAEHPTIQVGLDATKKSGFIVGMLGILNGLFGASSQGGGIRAIYDDKAKTKLLRFEKYDPAKHRSCS
jgi:hypothetical protein